MDEKLIKQDQVADGDDIINKTRSHKWKPVKHLSFETVSLH
jgi:hypothetical protein